MSPVQRDSTAGRAYLDLQQMARRSGRPTQELLLTYVLERFLFRLSRSEYRDRLVLKGGMLLAVLGSRRPTGDVDLLARAIDNDVAAIADVVRAVLSDTFDDGVADQTDDTSSSTTCHRIARSDASRSRGSCASRGGTGDAPGSAKTLKLV